MASTRILVNRRKAVRNIKKITRTMELIATARFKAAQKRAQEAEAYTAKIAELAADLAATAGEVTHPLLLKRDKIEKSVLLVICSNRGLCGGYNAGILREATVALRRTTAESVALQLELSGKRAINYFKYAGQKAAHQFTKFEDKPRFDEVEEIADRYLADFIAGKIDRVQVAYMKYINPAVQKPVVVTLLPLDRGATPEAKKTEPAGKTIDYEFMPDARGILEEILPVSFKVRLFKCFLDAAVSEQIARRVTMKQATENANDMIKAITQQYNRMRQANITREIMEIIGGVEALK